MLDPSQHSILLVGPRVVHLRSYFEKRHYRVDAVQKGVDGMTQLDKEQRDIVILELNLGDLTAQEFLMAARQAHADATFLLLDDASKAGQIVKAMQAGLDGYLPTPPDEDRLFFEVERHLRRAGGEDNHPRTVVSPRPTELESVKTALHDRESQIVELGMQNDLLNQELNKLRSEAKTLQVLRQALVGVIDGDLDEHQAMRIKERLALATVAETEVDTLREELQNQRAVRRELQEQLEVLKKTLAEQAAEGGGGGARLAELEADNMVLAGRAGELEEELELARAEVVALEQKHKAEVDDFHKELKRLTVDRAGERGDVARLQAEHAADLARIEREHRAQLEQRDKDLKDQADAQRAVFEERVAALKEEHQAELVRVQSDVEIERAAAKSQVEKVRAERDGELRQALDVAIAEKEAAVERALDIELVLDEHKARIDFLEGEVKKAQDRAARAETDFKRDKVRLIEEREAAASGSHEAFAKVQRFLDDNAALRRQNTELESNRSALEERTRTAEDEAQRARAELARQQDKSSAAERERATAAQARERAEAERNELETRVRALSDELDTERRRSTSAQAALGDAGQVSVQLAEALAKNERLERSVADLEATHHALDDALRTARLDLETLRAQASTDSSVVDDVRKRAQRVEGELAEAQAELARARLDAEQRLRAQQDEIVERYEKRLADALSGASFGGPTQETAAPASDAVVAERDAYKVRLQETEQWMQQAQQHLSQLAEERNQLHAQLSSLSGELTRKAAESQAYYDQLVQDRQAVEGLQQRILQLEADVQRPLSTGLDPQLLTQAQQERGLAQQQMQQSQQELARAQHQLQQVQAALSTTQEDARQLRNQLAQIAARPPGGGVPDELEPLRWTLNAAIEALSTIEAREPTVAAHLRNLRLLASALAKILER